ncbi:MAG: S-methyl-5-thioribose-1-phosphate isomerase [Betaproteobacteria bacterium]|nr:S-methyl-5-thioribose-1-phosphate isomerase [Betaproteobacteria bacterium]
MARTLWTDDAGLPVTWDQTRLPFEQVVIALHDAEACARAIATMQVRGAPLIGAVGAWGLALALREAADDVALQSAFDRLAATRPTAVNLRWALARVRAAVLPLPVAERAARAHAEALRLCDEDAACNAAIGRHGQALLEPLRRDGRPLQLLTHCNAGRLATIDHGTALAPIYALHEAGVALHVWVDETRPRNQGASLTAWELGERGVPHTVIADNAGGQLMREGRVDAVIVGCDRVAINGDVANKIGTYLKALAARDNGIPFLVACPVSTIDPQAVDGSAIPIETRDPAELTRISGRDDQGRVVSVQLTPDGSPGLNPAFDVTPARLVSWLITEHGPCRPDASALRALPGLADPTRGPA